MSTNTQADIGVVGMAVMGQNLALNIESRGHTVAVYNRTQSTLHEFVQRAGAKQLVPAASLAEFAASLVRPRKVLLMVQAGAAVDRVIADLQPHLEPGDILIDGGNSYFVDTIRRAQEAGQAGLRYIGTGVSGGEEGALLGPSIMPGGDRAAYDAVAPILTAISAKVDGDPCCTYIGADGAGHYVKMVHNGIEYGDMQLIAEAYSFMKLALGMSHAEMHDTFAEWNRGELDSYLIEITTDILAKRDPETGAPLPAGETGEIVATTLNKSYPLIRFGTGDLGALAPQPAPPCEGQQLLGLFGRSGDAIKVRGMFLHPNQLQYAVMQFPEIKAIQAIVTRAENRDAVTVNLELHEGASSAGLAEKLSALAQQATRLRIDAVNFVDAGSIDPSARTIIDEREWD